MSEVQLLRYRLKEGKRDQLYEWMEEVNSRRDAALDTLQAENVYSEAVVLDSRADGEYVTF
jgi:protease II